MNQPAVEHFGVNVRVVVVTVVVLIVRVVVVPKNSLPCKVSTGWISLESDESR